MRTAFYSVGPTRQTSANLARTFGCVRKVGNETLAWRHRRWHGEHLSTNVPEANAHLTALKRLPEFAYLAEVSSVPLQQVLRIQQKAFANFFAKRARYPRLKSRTGRQCAEDTRSAFRWRDGRLHLARQDGPLDLGLKDFAVTSDGVHVPHPKTLAKRERNLVRYQRMTARKKRGSSPRPASTWS